MIKIIKKLHFLKLSVPKRRYGTKQELRDLLYKFQSLVHDYGSESEDYQLATTFLNEEATEIALMIEGIAENVNSDNEAAYFNRACSELHMVIDALLSQIKDLEK